MSLLPIDEPLRIFVFVNAMISQASSFANIYPSKVFPRTITVFPIKTHDSESRGQEEVRQRNH